MKTLMMTAVLVAAIASPALAKTSPHSQIAHPHSARAEMVQGQYPMLQPGAVYSNGAFVAADPDLNIQSSLVHEYTYMQNEW